MFVLEIQPETRTVVVGDRDELFNDEVTVGESNWLARSPDPGAEVSVQLRYRAAPVGATVASSGERFVLHLTEPRAAITPGQSAVCYDGDRVLGGGRIVSASARSPRRTPPSRPALRP